MFRRMKRRLEQYESHVNAIIDMALAQYRQDAATIDDDAGALATAGQMGGNLVDVVLTITIAGVIGYVGLQIGSDTENSADFTTGTGFSNASNDITEGFETAFGLMDVVFIALMLSVIIVALVGLRRR